MISINQQNNHSSNSAPNFKGIIFAQNKPWSKMESNIVHKCFGDLSNLLYQRGRDLVVDKFISKDGQQYYSLAAQKMFARNQEGRFSYDMGIVSQLKPNITETDAYQMVDELDKKIKLDVSLMNLSDKSTEVSQPKKPSLFTKIINSISQRLSQ